jgi:spore germination protein GerM
MLVVAAAMATTFAVALSGCTGIPREGGVQNGQAAEEGDGPAPVFLPSRPQKDASQEQILRGFIEAASSPENKYQIAREFLTPEFSDAWKPDAGVTIDDGTTRTPVVIDPNTMQLAVNPVAEVNGQGEYHEFGSSTSSPLSYSFQQVDGQWRISNAPNGIVIDESTFSYVFSAQALYFYDPSFSYLVPDLRWFPRGATAPTRIVKAVLAGPSPWLQGGVVTAFPEGTELTADAVQVVARDAKIDLNGEALNADRITMQRMKYQLATSLPTGISVTITVNQNSQDIGDLGQAAPVVNPRVDARALILRGGEFGYLAATGSSLSPIPGISESLVPLNPLAVTLSPGQTVAAALTDRGVFGVHVGDDPVLLDPRGGLIAPSVDNFGYVWSVPATRPGELVVYNTAGEAIPVPTPWQEFTGIQALKVSRDGTRVIALLRSGGSGASEGSGTSGTDADSDTRFVVAAIKRDKNVPVGLGEPVVLASDLGTPLDATWIDDLTVASLSTLPGGEEAITAQQIGGVSVPLEPPPDSVTITGSNTLRDLRALSSEGGLEVQRGVGWQQRIDKVVLVATQQGIGG